MNLGSSATGFLKSAFICVYPRLIRILGISKMINEICVYRRLSRSNVRFPGVSQTIDHWGRWQKSLERDLSAARILGLALLVLAGAQPVLAQGTPDQILFGPKQYLRTASSPDVYTDSFTVPQSIGAPFLLRIVNGDANGANRLSSAWVKVNGVQVAGPADFGQNVASVERTVNLGPSNTLEVRTASGPDGFLTITVLGTRILPAPTSLTPNPLTITVGATGNLAATLAPAPTGAGALTVVSANAGVASVPASVSFAAGQTQVTIPVNGVASGTTTVTASANGGSASATVNVNPAPVTVTGLAPATLTLTQGANGTLTVTISAAQSADTLVALSSSNSGVAFVPSSVTVPAGSVTAPVTVSAVSAGTASITATLNASSASSQVTVTAAPPSVVSLVPVLERITLGANTSLVLTLSSVQSTDTVVALAASPAGIVSVASGVTVPAGQTSAIVPVESIALGQSGVTATLNASSASAVLNVVPPPARLVAIEPPAHAMTPGATSSFTVRINAAQLANTEITLAVDNPSVLQVPASVTVAQGQTSATFTATALATGSAIITASLNDVQRTATVQVVQQAAAIVSLVPSPLPLQQGAVGGLTVTINVAQETDTVIALANSAPAVVQVPASVTVPAGATAAAVTVTALAAGAAQVTASVSGTSAAATIEVAAPPPIVATLTPATLTLPKGAPGVLRVAVSRAPNVAAAVTLSSSNASFASVPATVNIAAGALFADFPVASNAEGQATITASLNGGTASASVTVTAAELVTLTLSPAPASAYIGETVQFTATGTMTDGTTQDFTTRVTWTSSNTAVATIAATGVASALAAGQTTITASFGYTAAQTGQPVTVTAATPFTVKQQVGLVLSAPTLTLQVGSSTTVTVSSSDPAPNEGLVITLAQSGAGSASFPPTVTIPANGTSTTFTLTGATVGEMTVTATATNRLPGFLTFTIQPQLSIASVAPTSGPVGIIVTLTGTGFDPVPGNNQLVFRGINNTTVPSPALTATATSITVKVPALADTGPITLTNSHGTAQSPVFTVTREQDFQLVVSPANLTVYQGASNSAQVQLASTGTRQFTGLVTLSVQGLPAGVTASFSPAATLSGFQTGAITFGASGAAVPGTYAVTVQASFTESGVPFVRSATLNLTVGAAGNVTGVKGRFVTPENQGIAGVIVRADIDPQTQPQTVTDAAGNFTLVGLAAGPVTLRFDATPANPLYPIWPYTTILVANQIIVVPDWTINPPPSDDKFTPITANSAQDQIITDPRFPGLEIKIPAGTSIIGWDGVPKARIAVERLDPDKLPVTGPPIPTKSVYQLYFGTPMGGLPSNPIPVTLPNDLGLEPGETTELWYYDGSPMGGTGEWKQGGTGTVSADGKVIVTNAGSGIPRFCGVCGLPCFLGNQNNAPNFGGCGPRGPKPISYASGQELPEEVDLSIDGLVPIHIGRTYNPFDAFANIAGVQLSLGQGWAFGHDVALLPVNSQLVRIVLPGNARTDFAREPDGLFRNHSDSRYEGAQLSLNSADAGHELKFDDGTRWRFAPFGGLGVQYLVSETDANGNALLITRRSNGRIDSIQGNQRSVAITYGTNGFISEVRDGVARTVRYTYNTTNRIETVTDTAGGVTRYTYVDDSELPAIPGNACANVPGGVRIKTILYPGQTNPVENFHGSSKRVLRQRMPDGTETRYAYKLTGACVINVSNPTTRCSGATCPNVDSWENFEAGWRIYGGTIASTSVTDARGNTTTHRLNTRGLESEVTNALGQTVRYDLDANNRPRSMTDAAGRVTRYTYDAVGNILRITDHGGQITDFTYDPKWQKPATITVYQDDGTPLVTRHTYDPNTGNLLQTTDPRGLTATYTFNARGQIATVTNSLGKVMRFTYGPSGDIQAVTDPLGFEAAFDSDAVGRAQSETDPLGRTSRFVLNARNQIVEFIDPENLTTRFTYDPRGNLASVTDRAGRTVVQYTYDSMNRVETRTDASGRIDRYAYDATGNLVTHTDRAIRTHQFSYDALDRPIESRFSDGSIVTRRHDAIGRLTEVRDGEGAVALDYDNLDRVTRVVTPQGEIRYAYDGLDRLTRLEKPAGAETFAYDANGNITRITRGADVYEIVYDDGDRRSELRLPNGITAFYSYDDNNRLTSLVYRRGTTVLEEITYAYDAAGNILNKDRANISSLSETAFSATYDVANRMTGITLGGVVYTLEYDELGNLVRRIGPSETITYTWDVRGRLTQINSPGVTASFRYDAMGRRVERVVNGEVTTYLYDGDQAVVEFGPAGTTDNLVGADIDEVLARYSQTGNRWLLADHLGSVLGLVDAGGLSTTLYAYSPYGETSVLGSGETNPLQYTGRENDGTGLYFYRARYYDALLKRFISEDPIGIAAGLNLYQYVGGDPVSFNDPSGEIIPAVITGLRLFCMRFPRACAAAANAARNAIRCMLGRGGGPKGGASGGKSAGGKGNPDPKPSNTTTSTSAGGSQPSAPGSAGGQPGTNAPSPNTPGASKPGAGGSAGSTSSRTQDVLQGATKGRTGKSQQYTKPGGEAQANKDFDRIVGNQPTTQIGNGGRATKLPDGTGVSVRPTSTEGSPTLQINQPGRPAIKIRYK